MKIEENIDLAVTEDGALIKSEDPRLGRIANLDERNRNYPAMRLLSPHQQKTLRGCNWYLKLSLNQGNTPACTGFSRTLDLHASPEPLRMPNGKHFTHDFAYQLYKLAQKHDEWPGELYDGSSVLGAIKAAAIMGYVGEYRWAFGIDEMLAALAWLGPVIVGSDWLNSMFEPRPNGLIEVDATSGNAGGHAYLIRNLITTEWYIRHLLGPDEEIREGVPLVRGTNTWGENWGWLDGEFLMWADDLEELLKGIDWPGEAAIVTIPLQPSE